MPRFIGDVHGKFNRYRDVIRNVPESYQLGDMGVGFISFDHEGNERRSSPPFDSMSKGNHKFIRGNHDNPEVCLKHPYFIPDGTVIDNMMFIGGATSIDKQWRTRDIDWWADEECSASQLEQLLNVYALVKPEVMCTHEAPQFIADYILYTHNMPKYKDPSNTREMLDRMFGLHQPKYWLFGHWHRSLNIEVEKTRFICLNELEYIDLEV